MFTNKKREGINTFVCVFSLYVTETPKASINKHELPLPIIPFGIVAYGFVGQPFSKQLYSISKFVALATHCLIKKRTHCFSCRFCCISHFFVPPFCSSVSPKNSLTAEIKSSDY